MQIKKLLIVVAVLLTSITIKPAFAIDDGAYLIGRSTSYVNPLTGTSEDGGTNITLGESMVSSIVEGQLLLEQVNGKIYVTIGLGLASNVSNVRIKTMNSSGSFSNASATVTGSSSANGDTVKHYRIQMNSLNDYISPILYVTPMGRDVQFFIKLNQGSITAGTGIYSSQMIPSSSSSSSDTSTSSSSGGNSAASSSNSTSSTNGNNQDTTTVSGQTDSSSSEQTQEVDAPVETVGQVTKDTLFEGVTGLTNYVIGDDGKVDDKKEMTAENLLAQTKQTASSSNSNLLIVAAVIVVVIAVTGGIYYVKKVKK